MKELGIALAGVLAGAVVSEGLRMWRSKVETDKRLRGAKRLVLHELMMNVAMISGEEVTPEVLRKRLKSGSISLDKWKETEVLLSETLPDEVWYDVASANLVLAKMMSEAEQTKDGELTALATAIKDELKQAVELLTQRASP